ncbi:MAG: FAD-binding oxidoreductase [Deltaproteobacteria bacterium]|nr:FAD-binding oxidoreductase [Deltaproteobacteria bacterium]
MLERELKRKGLTLGHFPSSIYVATLGGYLACRSAGQYSSLYGKIEDMVEGMQVVLADGRIVDLDDVRDCPDVLDLKELFLGSEGTLGIMTEATLRVHPQPESDAFLGFRFGGLDHGLEAIRKILQSGLKPAVVRLYDELDTQLFSSHKKDGGELPILERLGQGLGPALSWAKEFSFKLALGSPGLLKQAMRLLPNHCMLILGFQGAADLTAASIAQAREICLSRRSQEIGEEPGRYWLKHRYSVSYKLSPLFDEGYFADTMEVATTWDNLRNLYDAIRDAVSKHALVLAHFSHAYAEGCSIYFTFVAYRESETESQSLYDRIWREALRACVAAGGTISHHHGVGLLKADFMGREWGPAMEWLKRMKRRLDPSDVLNPGKLGFADD